MAAGWLRNTIYAWRATDGAYTMPDTLEPWYGYWVRTYEDGLTLTVDRSEGAAEGGLSFGGGSPAPLALSVPPDLPPKPSATGATGAELSALATPNPVRESSVRFQVTGPLASETTEIQVQVLDGAGRSVFEGSAAGTEIRWSADGLASGLYLYRLKAKVAGDWITSAYEKLLTVR